MDLQQSSSYYTKEQFKQFQKLLEKETASLYDIFQKDSFQKGQNITGCEVEFWLMNSDGLPVPANQSFLEVCDRSDLVPEVSQFNFEFNSKPVPLKKGIFQNTKSQLDEIWQFVRETTKRMGHDVTMIGSLPTFEKSMLCESNLSGGERYKALNEGLNILRGHPAKLLIESPQGRVSVPDIDIMMVASTTSHQIHLQAEPDELKDLYNASLLASAFTVAISANSPFLFGQHACVESRIAAFEQAVSLPTFLSENGEKRNRVGLGSGYCRESLFELFEENLKQAAVVLPQVCEEKTDDFYHVKFHNGTTWRWTRPIIDRTSSGEWSLRIEHRVPPAGPTVIDMVTNMVFYLGFVKGMLKRDQSWTERLPFSLCRHNFYQAVESGLDAKITWLDGETRHVADVILEDLIPVIEEGLVSFGVTPEDYKPYLEILIERVKNRQNGAKWQVDFHKKHGSSFPALVKAYRERQETGEPVHLWTL
jgi:gamma-glutamyl:cysteine ligase YbdK (ATP-grasp superfamily)